MNRKASRGPAARSKRTLGGALVATALLLAHVSPGHCQSRGWEADYDDEKKAWKEIEAVMPAYPQPGALVAFDGGGASGHRFFIDAPSLSIGADGVVRYTLVVKTTGGATNVSYEGIRCEERQQKTYAVGLPSGSWVRAREPAWRRIQHQSINNHHGVLYVDYLCQGKEPARNVKEVLQRLRQGGPGR